MAEVYNGEADIDKVINDGATTLIAITQWYRIRTMMIECATRMSNHRMDTRNEYHLYHTIDLIKNIMDLLNIVGMDIPGLQITYRRQNHTDLDNAGIPNPPTINSQIFTVFGCTSKNYYTIEYYRRSTLLLNYILELMHLHDVRTICMLLMKDYSATLLVRTMSYVMYITSCYKHGFDLGETPDGIPYKRFISGKRSIEFQIIEVVYETDGALFKYFLASDRVPKNILQYIWRLAQNNATYDIAVMCAEIMASKKLINKDLKSRLLQVSEPTAPTDYYNSEFHDPCYNDAFKLAGNWLLAPSIGKIM